MDAANSNGNRLAPCLAILGTGSDVGKSVVTTALCRILRRRGVRVAPFKVGPDYIDPIWLGLAGGRPCRNLDFYMQPHDELVDAFARHGANAYVALV